MELPLVGLHKPVKHAPPEFYNAVPVITIAKGYPVYHPDKEPKGYMDALRQKEPESVWKGPPGTKTQAVKGHRFGLDLPADDRRSRSK
jgi:hypothetical protein